MKTWKIITIVGVALVAIALLTASAVAFMGGRGIYTPYNPYSAYPNGGATATPTLPTGTPAPITQANAQVPTLYTPPNVQVTTPGYFGYSGMGGCMRRWGYVTGYPTTGTATTTLTINQAEQTARTYVASLNNPDLKVTQVEEYTGNFYVQVGEVSTGYGAFQLLINKVTGVVTPEMGPNMIWNTKYTFGAGYCNWLRGTATTATPTVTVDQAKANAQQYLTVYLPDTTAGDVTTFYGYYNVEVLNSGATYGMLSVNAYTGQIWYHTWHGTFIQELQVG